MSADALERFMSSNSNFIELLRPRIENEISGGLIVAELLKQQNFEVTEADRDLEIEISAKNMGLDPEAIKKAVEGSAESGSLDDRVKERKMLELIESKNTVIKGKKVNYLDLFPQNA
jgi:FKBP-type peptidyl-prolyl cis-trans isomerase (trigger factor)